MMAVTVVVPQQVVALPVVVVAPHLLDVAVVTTLLARMIAGTVTTNVGTAIALAVQMTEIVMERMSAIETTFVRTEPMAKIGKLPLTHLLLHMMSWIPLSKQVILHTEAYERRKKVIVSAGC